MTLHIIERCQFLLFVESFWNSEKLHDKNYCNQESYDVKTKKHSNSLIPDLVGYLSIFSFQNMCNLWACLEKTLAVSTL